MNELKVIIGFLGFWDIVFVHISYDYKLFSSTYSLKNWGWLVDIFCVYIDSNLKGVPAR